LDADNQKLEDENAKIREQLVQLGHSQKQQIQDSIAEKLG